VSGGASNLHLRWRHGPSEGCTAAGEGQQALGGQQAGKVDRVYSRVHSRVD
jgi:hypothetical protein